MNDDTRARLLRMRLAAAMVTAAADSLARARASRARATAVLVAMLALLGTVARAAHRTGWTPAGIALVGAVVGMVVGGSIELARHTLAAHRWRKALEAARDARDERKKGGEDGA